MDQDAFDVIDFQGFDPSSSYYDEYDVHSKLPFEGDGLEDLRTLLQTVIDDREKYRRVLKSRGDEAQRFLDALQMVRSSSGFARYFTETPVLDSENDAAPIKAIGNRPVAGGGFADVWKGKVDKQLVCLKVVKVYLTSDVQQALKRKDRSSCRDIYAAPEWDTTPQTLIRQNVQHPSMDLTVIMRFLDSAKTGVSATAIRGEQQLSDAERATTTIGVQVAPNDQAVTSTLETDVEETASNWDTQGVGHDAFTNLPLDPESESPVNMTINGTAILNMDPRPPGLQPVHESPEYSSSEEPTHYPPSSSPVHSHPPQYPMSPTSPFCPSWNEMDHPSTMQIDFGTRPASSHNLSIPHTPPLSPGLTPDGTSTHSFEMFGSQRLHRDIIIVPASSHSAASGKNEISTYQCVLSVAGVSEFTPPLYVDNRAREMGWKKWNSTHWYQDSAEIMPERIDRLYIAREGKLGRCKSLSSRDSQGRKGEGRSYESVGPTSPLFIRSVELGVGADLVRIWRQHRSYDATG
ncbi:Rho guanine nucleotide exchange factor [Marasmius tenuissimus]|uniref:Rho guanine nucleotide exchange factor n=1 Tax=Marasmius tenuissimus TaxID=585030 RepID=A0ABR3A268_9AGAR